MHRLAIVALVVAAYGGWHWWSTERAVHRPPGIVAPDEPVQVNLEPSPRFEAKGYTFVKRAKFDITARLLRKEVYRFDGSAALAPVDLGVGWGPLSDSAMLEGLEFSQMGRFFYWRPRKADFPLPTAVLISHMAQMHVIPADKKWFRNLAVSQIIVEALESLDLKYPKLNFDPAKLVIK